MARTAAQRFSETAAAYAATMAPSLRRIAETVVHRARLQPGERVLDVGTGTGIAAAAARGAGRSVTGVDAAPGMLEIARRDVGGVEFREMDFTALDFADGSFDVVVSSHALLFATDVVAALAEWRRVTRPGGRLSLSVPGPDAVTPSAIYAELYERYGIETTGRYPTTETLTERAGLAGWRVIDTAADPDHAIVLASDELFRQWRDIGARGAATADFTEDQHEALTEEMRARTPHDARGAYRIPFGALYLSAMASNPSA